MNFVRKRKIGCTQKTYREWLSEDGHYRITWRSEVWGVRVRSGYHACVRSMNLCGHVFWSFAGARRPFKTRELAIEACEKNRRLWDAFCKLAETERAGRADRVRALDAKATIGSGAAAHKIMSVLPTWVKAQAEPFLLRLLYPVGRRKEEDECDDDMNSNAQGVDGEASMNTESGLSTQESGSGSSPIPEHGPVPTASASAKSPSQRRRAKPAAGTRAKSAKASASAAKPKSKRHTTKRRKTTTAG